MSVGSVVFIGACSFTRMNVAGCLLGVWCPLVLVVCLGECGRVSVGSVVSIDWFWRSRVNVAGCMLGV